LGKSNAQVYILSARYNHIGSAGLKALQESPHIDHVIADHNDGQAINKNQLSNTATTRQPTNVRALQLYCYQKMTDACLQIINN
jgi:hypothetical protein